MSDDARIFTADALRFYGDTHHPSTVTEVVSQRPELGSGVKPAELESMAESAHDEPRQGKTGAFRPAAEFLAEIDPQIDLRGYGPDWIDTLPVPRAIPEDTGKPLRRLDGRRLVRPFDTTRFPPEERRVYRDAARPWGHVCKLFTSERPDGAGSAALIGPRIAVTAAHCVPRTSSWWMRVVPAYYDGGSLYGAGVQSYVSDWRAFDSGDEVCGYDWAVLRLYEPLGDGVGYFGVNGYDDDWEDRPYWTTAGYPSAINSQRPSYQMGVSVFDDDSDSNGGMELETRADLGPGNSGGPLWGQWGGDWRVLGVVSGEEYDWAVGGGEWGNVVASGSGFGNLVAWARTNWPL
ncbi:MAG TPA: serine protease [Microbacterium sp.]|nr:serine protease [Microbacterium sp.]